MTLRTLTAILICWLASPIPAADTTSLEQALRPMIDAHQGEVAVSVKHLGNAEAFQYRPNAVMPTASLIKLAVMIEAYRQVEQGQRSLDDLLEIRAADQVPGSGILTKHFGAGSRLTFRDVIRLMMAYSDNTATNLVVDHIGLPATEAAVIQFQKAYKLPPTGIVESTTWVALGPLLTERVPVPEPDIVNAEVLPVLGADTLDGPPIVSCRAWAVADAVSGKMLAGHDSNVPRDIASTTKIMTAYLVLQLAQETPSVLQETVTFSQRADRTRGSTAAIEEGEQLPVSELLYGLLLPSGNDAAVALAEHFGARFSPSETIQVDSVNGADPLPMFVAEMNRTAAHLEMTNTTFQNPHGLTQDNHLSTAEDLLKLTFAALQLPAFRHYVSTRQHGCVLTGPGGYRRNVRWKNTNRLLGIDGYLGIKTGTTSDAGACLVAYGQHADQQRLLVVLGSESSAGRYVDARNLFRWAWQPQAE